MTKEEQARQFSEWYADNYERLFKKYNAFCVNKGYEQDYDVFADTFLKVHDKILKNGIQDPTDTGFDNYLFRTFATNLLRETQYARNKRRDASVTDVAGIYENYFNATNDTSKDKLISDLWKDYATLYILKEVEKNFDSESFYLFRLKMLMGYTYRELVEKTGIPTARFKVLRVKAWLEQNVRKTDVQKAFYETFGELIDF